MATSPTIEILDLGFRATPLAIGAFLVRADRGPILIETGPASTLENLKARLAEHGVEPTDVRHLLVTHIHFDHAGAAGWWATRGTRVWVHPKGAPHLIDPSRLEASARRIYGDAMDELWGPITPAPAERVSTLEDGQTIEIEGLRVTALDTPGHANHHLVYRIGDVAFTGDLAGIRLPGTEWIDLPAPPPEFDLEKWKASLDRLRGEDLAKIYRTHFGPSEDVAAEIDRTEALLEEIAEYIRGLLAGDLDRDSMIERYADWVRRRGVAAGAGAETLRACEVTNPRDMSVDGIVRYWRKREERAAAAAPGPR